MRATGETSFGGELRARRIGAGLSQRELAVRAGLSLAAVRDLEQGRTLRPKADSLRALATALEMDSGDAAAWLSTADGREPASGRIWVGVLGPLVVRRGEQDVRLGPGRRRAFLARLAMAAGETVPPGELVDLLWPREQPRSAAGAMQTSVSRLRSLLGPDGVIELATHGYRLLLDEDGSDLVAFRSAVAAARRAGDPERELELLTGALHLWRGEALCDVPELRGHALLAPLTEERIAVALRQAELAQASGRPEVALAGLRALAAEHPMHEPLHARLIRVLGAAGRTAAGLEVFDTVRRRLRDELGIDPGAGLTAAHRHVLRGNSAPTPSTLVAAQLPAGVPRFAGRHRELRQLDDLAGTDRRTTAVITVTGTAGIGKTALTLHWAHRVRNRFPDGQLHLNLRGFDPAAVPVSPIQAVGRFLDALGVPAQRVPAALDAQTALLRSTLADRRVLIVLDNARDDEQVRPLLPGGPGCLVVVTSRGPLTGLVAEGAHALPLSLLSDEEAGELLAGRLGSRRVAAEPAAAEEIIRRCARLPLALAIVAARAATVTGLRLTGLADELRDQRHRLDALTTGSPATDLRSVFSWSYRSLAPDAARLFRLLGLHPGPEVSVAAAASLAGRPVAEVRRLLAVLVRAQLLTEQGHDRYAMHDLLRAYAGELVLDQDGAADRTAATERMLDHFVHSAQHASVLINPGRRPVEPPPARAGAVIERPADNAAAMAWFGAEHEVLRSAVEWSAAEGLDDYCGRLAWTLWNFLDRRGLWHELAATQEFALAAAERRGDLAGQAVAHRAIARACNGLSRTTDALDHYQRALACSTAAGDRLGRVMGHLGSARALDHLRRPADALAEAQRALALFPPDSTEIERAWSLNTVGWHRAQLGEYGPALEACREALALLQLTSDRYSQAATWDSIGFAHRHLGDRVEAESCYRQAFALYRGQGARFPMAETLLHLGDMHVHFDDRDAARTAYRGALEILEDLSHPEAAAVRAKLETLDT